jgi:hypothetical protein
MFSSVTEKWDLDGVIRLSVAFSRDQDEKIYVQDLLQRDAEEIWRLINKVYIIVKIFLHLFKPYNKMLNVICSPCTELLVIGLDT